MMDQELWAPLIDGERCTGCGDCVEQCLPEALQKIEETAVLVDAAACTYCADCEAICPEGAIALPYEIILVPDAHVPPEPPRPT